MLLRSSSTPILESLLSTTSAKFLPAPTTTTYHHHQPIPTLQPLTSSLRRTRSDGNLLTLLSDTHHHHQHHRFTPILDTIPSFSMDPTETLDQVTEIEVAHGGASSIAGGIGKAAPPLFLARGLGIDRIGSGLMSAGGDFNGGGGGDCTALGGDHGKGQSELEMHYKKLVEEDPSNALFLRNYGEFLYQVKGDGQRAEEYYSRAIVADPGDGEILSQYARLLWELHRDEERASTYFTQAVRVAPEDSHVLAAYATFLWEAEEGIEEEDDGVGVGGGDGDGQSQDYGGSIHHDALASSRT